MMKGDREAMWDALRGELLVAPSLLSANFARLAEDIAAMERAGARVLHLDVMDGHFVPNITFGPPLVSAVRKETGLWLDAHLMVEDPARFLEPFARAGADSITVHVETKSDPEELRIEADRLGVKLGLAIRPDSPVEETLDRWGATFDLILIMTVMPGFGGQAYMPGSEERLVAAARYAAAAPRKPVLEVDGGIRPGTAEAAARAGALWLVAGNALFRAEDPGTAFESLQIAARTARAESKKF
jgi:ribulose-phosphate 3-epimerase